MDDGSPFCLQDQRCPSRATAAAKEALQLSEHMNDRNNALRLYVSDLTAVMLRMVAGIDHLSDIARQWEPDHSSGSDRRGWLLAKDARDDALRLLQEHSKLLVEDSTKFQPARVLIERDPNRVW
ncbi:MAG TPA: hypothetical protein VFH49_08705, partial [Aquabacterium sp.]|nr:hypothetical protein [Aquabacterium sp.]